VSIGDLDYRILTGVDETRTIVAIIFSLVPITRCATAGKLGKRIFAAHSANISLI